MIVTAIIEYCKKQFCLFSVFDFETAHPECKRYQKFEYTRASVISDYQWQKQICEIRIAKCKSVHTLALVKSFEFVNLSVFNICICIESSQKILEVLRLWYAKRIRNFFGIQSEETFSRRHFSLIQNIQRSSMIWWKT